MDLDLQGRVAFVTGGGAGVGEAVARALAAEGCTVFIADRAGPATARVAADIVRSGQSARPITVDVASAASGETAFADIGATDILVNAAGLLSPGDVADLPASEFDRIARVNLNGVIHCVKAAVPTMVA